MSDITDNLKSLWNEMDPGLKLGLLVSLPATAFDAMFAGPRTSIADRVIRNALIGGTIGYGSSKLKSYLDKKHLAKEVEKTYGDNIVGTGVKSIVNKMYDNGMKSKFRWE
jgi:hypothetical protein|nr:MAG TPA: hypothetical protein [Caudoviricetes sp.]